MKVKGKRKTEISLEIEETIVVRTKSILIRWCKGCRKPSRMIAADEAAMMTGLSARGIYRLVDTGEVHFTEDQNRLLFVCVTSLHHLASGPGALSLPEHGGELG